MQLSVSRALQGARARRGCSVPRRAVRCSAQQAGAASDAPLLRVGFSLRARVGFGDTVKLTGSHAALGEWDVARAVPLAWAQDGDGADVWTAVVELPEHFVVRYKVRRPQGGPHTVGSVRPHLAPLVPLPLARSPSHARSS
jgi:hypothetical protein